MWRVDGDKTSTTITGFGLDRTRQKLFTAIDERIRFVGGHIVDADGHAVRQDVARKIPRTNTRQQGGMNGGLLLGMARAFWRHGENGTIEQLVAPGLPLGPGEIFIHCHARFRQCGHDGMILDQAMSQNISI